MRLNLAQNRQFLIYQIKFNKDSKLATAVLNILNLTEKWQSLTDQFNQD